MWERLTATPASATAWAYSNGWYIVATPKGIYRTQQLSGNTTWGAPIPTSDTILALHRVRGAILGVARQRIFISTNDGLSWGDARPWPSMNGFKEFLTDGQSVYIVRSSVVLRSSDYGATWYRTFLTDDGQMTATWYMYYGGGLAFHPNGRGYAISTDLALWTTSDHGLSWKMAKARIPGRNASSNRLWVAASGDVYLYGWHGDVGEYKAEFFVSHDNGRTFTDLNPTADVMLPTHMVDIGSDVLIGGYKGYFDIFETRLSPGIFRTTDHGVTWQDMSSGYSGDRVTAMTVLGGYVIIGDEAGVYYKASVASLTRTSMVEMPATASGPATDDHVATVESFSNLRVVQRTRAFTTMGDWVYIVMNSGIFRRRAEGPDLWQYVTDDDVECEVRDIATDGNRLVALTEHGIMVSDASGMNWERVPPSWPTITIPMWITTYPMMASRRNALFLHTESALYRSTDHGATWKDLFVNAGAEVRTSTTFAVGTNGAIYVAEREGRLYRTTDDGGSWHAVPSPFDGAGTVGGVWISEAGDLYLYSMLSFEQMFEPLQPFHLYVSTDDGATFRSINADGITRNASCFLDVRGAVVMATNVELRPTGGPARVRTKAIWSTMDHGATWTEVSTIPHPELDPLYPDRMAVAGEQLIYRLIDTDHFYWRPIASDITSVRFDESEDRSVVIARADRTTTITVNNQDAMTTYHARIYDLNGRHVATYGLSNGDNVLPIPLPLFIHIVKTRGE